MPLTPAQILANPGLVQDSPSLHPQHGRWLRDGLLPSLAAAGSPSAERWVSPYPGNVAAVGSATDPFNPTSAAALHGGDPIAQAIASFPAPTNAQEELTPAIVHMIGGAYPNPATFRNCAGGRRFTLFLSLTFAAFPAGSNVYVEPVPSPFATGVPSVLAVNPEVFLGQGFTWQIDGPITISDLGIAAPAVLSLAFGFMPGAISELAPLADFCMVQATGVQFGGAITIPSCNFSPVSSAWSSGLAAKMLDGSVRECSFGGAISLAFSTTNPILACQFNNGPNNWTGPAGSARFDQLTAASFAATGGNALTGGASLADYENPDLETVSAVVDCVPGATVSVQLAVPANRQLTRLSILTTNPPATDTATLSVIANGNNLLAAASFDLTTLTPFTLEVVPLTATLAFLQLEEAQRIRLDIAQGALGTAGQQIAIVATLAQGTRPLY